MRGSSDEDVDRMKTRVFNHDSWGPLNNLVIKMVVPGVMLVVVESMILVVVVMMAGVNKNFFMGKLGWTKDKEW